MKLAFVSVFLLVLIVIAGVFLWNRRKETVSFVPAPSPAATLEEKLADLAACGIALRPGVSADDLLSSWDRADYEEPGYELLLTGIGMAGEAPPYEYRSDMLWHFDPECIADEGSYVAVARRLSEIAGGSLPLANLRDHVDLEEGEAWLAFECQGREYKIPCKVEDDWVDPAIFRHFVALLEATDPGKIFIYYDLGGQDCIIGCLPKALYDDLKRLIPKVEPLS